MLDVHAPEHSIGGVRDFLIHLFTITCGLLIALGLEDAAAAMHHRHDRKEAEASIREEIIENRKGLLEAKPQVLAEIKGMQALLAYVKARSLNQPADTTGLTMNFSEGTIPDAAWRTATSTGVVSFMPYTEVERFSTAYKEQGLLQTTEEQTLNDFLELGSFLPPDHRAKLDTSPESARAALPYVRHALAHLQGMYAIGTGLFTTYDEALKQ